MVGVHGPATPEPGDGAEAVAAFCGKALQKPSSAPLGEPDKLTETGLTVSDGESR